MLLNVCSEDILALVRLVSCKSLERRLGFVTKSAKTDPYNAVDH